MQTADIITRAEWSAKPPKNTPTRITLPSPELYLHHTSDMRSGSAGVRSIQRDHQAKWSDIGYSFLIDRVDLAVYEGRGAGVLGAHTYGRNSYAHGIAVMGNYEVNAPQERLIARIVELVQLGHRERWWASPALTGGHRDVVATACPGVKLYDRIPDINRLAGGSTVVPPSTNQPDPYDRRVQQAIEAAGFKLAEFGADGFIGAESATAAELLSRTFITQRKQLSDVRTRLAAVEAQLTEAERNGRAGELFRQAIIALERG